MGRRPLVPWDQLALSYISAVEQGRPPAKSLRQEFGLSERQVGHRRGRMGRTGWLPPGNPVVDGRRQGHYDQEWLSRARELTRARLRERLDQATVRERDAARRAQVRLLRAERRAAMQRRQRPPRPGRVLDVFL